MNNNKRTITICSIIALVILAIVVVVTLISELTGFSIIFGAFFIVLTVCLAIYLREEPDEFNAFIKNKKRILRTYDSIIVEVEDIPNIAGKNIIKVKSIEDLVDAQLELREPIYYKNDNDSCFFILLHFNEACIYVLRMNDSVVSPTEQSIRYMKEETPDKTKEQENILENLEKTVVYKLDELRSFRISPIRNNEKINVVDDTAIKKEIEVAKEQEITSSALSSEISKTMYLKDLRERMLKYEEEQMSKTKELKKESLDAKPEDKVVEVEKEKIEETEVKEEPEKEVSPIERLKKMVKEQELALTKEHKINKDLENSSVEEKDTEITETKDIKLKIMDDTDVHKNALDEVKESEPILSTASTVRIIDEIEEEKDDDDFMDGIVVVHSLDEEETVDDEDSYEEELNDSVIAHVIVDDDDDEEVEPEKEDSIQAFVVDDTSNVPNVVEDLDDELTEENIVEEQEQIEIQEEVEEPQEQIREKQQEDKVEHNVNKPRKTTKPRKVTHSTRRAQKHTNRTKR